MTREEAIRIVKEANKVCPQLWYYSKQIDGTRKQIKLVITEDGELKTFVPKSVHRTMDVDTSDWLWLRPFIRKRYDLFRNNVRLITDYLELSGFWTDYASQLSKFSEISDAEIERIFDKSVKVQREFLDKHGITLLTTQMFRGLMTKRKFIHAVDYSSKNAHIKKAFQQAILEKKPFKVEWGACNEKSIVYNPSEKKAYYTELFRGQKSGHFFVLLDDMHATFRTDK